MKPYGWKIKSGCDCIHCGNPKPKSKKVERQKAKKLIKKELKETK